MRKYRQAQYIIGIYLSMICIVISVSAGCAKKEPYVAIVNKQVITEEDFSSRIAKLPERYQDVIRANKKKFLDELIVDTLLYQEALRLKLDEDEDARAVIEEAKKKIIIAKLLNKMIDKAVTLDEAEAREYYDNNLEEFQTPEILRASHIMVRTEKEANDIVSELANGKNFEDLARTQSIDPSATRGGDIGYFARGQITPDFEKVCFNMQEGEISDIIQTRFGFHIIKLTERKARSVEEFKGVRGRIIQDLLVSKKKKAFNELAERLREEAKIIVNEESSVFFSIEDREEDNE